GRYDRSSWVVDCPNLSVRGGYARDFSRRTPWETPSVFAVFAGYEATRENNLISGRSDHAGLVLDGLCFDAAGRNTYGDKPGEGIRAYAAMDGPIASFNAKNVTIMNCVFANSAHAGVELAGEGSRFENNLVVNMIGIGMLTLRNPVSGGPPITVTGNTFGFAHDVGPPCGTGADQAIGLRVGGPAVVQENVFISCGNAAIALYRDLDRVSIDRNLFYLTPRDVVNSRMPGNTADITEANIDEMEDVGLKSAAGNVVQDPGMSGIPTQWLDAYSRHLLANYVKPPRDAANAVRAAAGLPALAPADLEKEESKGGFAPRLAPADVLALRFAAKQGYHPVELAVETIGRPGPSAVTFRPIDWNAIDTPEPSLANQPVELRAGLGYEQNTSLLADAGPATHMGIRVYRPGSDDGSIYVLARRSTLVNRQFEEAVKYTNGREVESTCLLRGTYRADLVPTSRQKVTLVVEAIVPGPVLPKEPAARPAGRDWFVRAGASGGDGSREKPFRDPFQALDKAEGGDAVHVAGGDYFGKLRSGKWKLLIRNLSLLGGYDAEFTERDPWKHPTRFVLNEEEKAKGTPEGTMLASDENSDGLILDGFVFDGSTYNSYTPEGALDLKRSPQAPMVSLRGGQSAITVRNCVFVNGSGAGISISCPFGVFENNVILNVSGWSLGIRADGPGPWTVRNNTVLFACDPTPRAGTGKSSSDGTLFQLSGRAVVTVDANIFAFADNFGVRSTIPQQNVSLSGNVFAACLYIHLTDAQYLWADASTWERRADADSAFASFEGNTLDLPKLPVDPAFADAALERLFALPSRVATNQWRTFAAQIGSAAIPAIPGSTAATEPPKPAAAPDNSLDSLLASLSSTKDKLKEAETSRTATVTEAPYCPVADWRNALALFLETPSTGPGAHRLKLSVSFATARARSDVQYTSITAQAIDADHASLDTKAVQLEVTQLRSSSTDPSQFPADLTGDDYEAYAITTVGDASRTHVAILVRRDTTASKLLDRAAPTDKFLIRGTARLPRNPGALAIVADTAEAM
ncbi:MAG: right-handed parallel beta-helix repeat-containing protein, partial [Gemmatimonadales bacterium]|nr:right-handed parallel beta-helix repeat-containing protein [Gemmatimonadales bacterium]